MMIYISGPITGTTDYMERFAAAERRLWKDGWDNIVNPAELNSRLPEGTSWEKYMGASLALLCDCDAIYMMRGWEKSRGARLELMVAMELGLKIVIVEQENNKK